MAETVVAVAPAETPPAEVDAARAAASAQTAAEAAAAALSMAEVGAARVNQDAAERMASFENEVSSWRGQLNSATERLNGLEKLISESETRNGERQASLQASLSSIQERLPPPPPPRQTNPAIDPPAADPPADEPPPPPAKKRAHRFI